MGRGQIFTAPIGIFFGRMGNFINGELYGKPTTVPWAMVFPGRGGRGKASFESSTKACWKGFFFLSFCGFIGTKRNGTGMFLRSFSYATPFPHLCEFFRGPPHQQVGYILGVFTMGQLLSAAMLVIGLVLKFVYLPRYERGRPG